MKSDDWKDFDPLKQDWYVKASNYSKENGKPYKNQVTIANPYIDKRSKIWIKIIIKIQIKNKPKIKLYDI